ncbi:uncharacterized protein [Leuresthes tenuis]|uniref:uncharacterized protein n=1 Tax=Leuresthes tenuis TaxID=355514 RepID=UPI003B513705
MSTQTIKISSEFKDIISNSDQIRPGPPFVYQLRTKKEMFGTLRRRIVGEKDVKKPNKTILLVGETGAGKSALIDALVNCIMGVKWEDEVWFQIVDEEERRSQTESQTSDVTVYQIFGFEGKTLPYSLTIIDTPGYGDTKGIEHDAIIRERLFDLFQSEDGVHEVHAVGLVLKATENRLSERLMYIFDSVMSLFGKDLEKNIVALITHSDGGRPANALQALEAAKIKCSRNEKNQPVHFLFNNCQHEDRTEETEMCLEYAWRVTNKGMSQFKTFLENSSPQQQTVTSEVQKECVRLTACIQNLQQRIRFNELKQRIKQTQESVEVYKELKPIKAEMFQLGCEAAVRCKNCKENCHYPGCTMASNPQHCEVMRGGYCTSCSGKCPASDHVKENQRYVIRTRKVQRTGNPQSMKELTAEESQLLNETFQHVVRLNHVALDVDSVSTSVLLDFLIKKMKEKGDTERLKELRKIDKQMDDETRAALKLKMRSISSNYEDFTSESIQIRSGSPSVYQLRTKKEMFGTLTRRTVGEKDVKKPNKTILLVGETGAGKSALIDALVNCIMGVKWEDEVWFQIVDEEERRSQTESQTSDVIVYQIFGFEGKTLPYSLTIIDTPGYGDTKGIEHDAIVSQRLFDLFRSEDGVHEVHAVGLVLKAAENRLSEQLMYIFDSVMSLFGKDLEKNIVALITHSDGGRPENALHALEAAKIKCSRNEENQPVHFLFNNCQKTQRGSEKEKAHSKLSWCFTNEQIGHMSNLLERSQPQTLKTTLEVLNERIRLTACIQNLEERINLTELKQTEIRQTEEALKKHQDEMKENEEFTVEVDEVYKVKEPIEGGMWGLVFYRAAVTCSVCEENCHYPGCTMAWKPSHCEVMEGGRCTVCTNKCPAEKHVKEEWKYGTKTRKVQKTLNDMKEKHEGKKAECENTMTLLENLKKEMNQLTAQKSQLLDEAFEHVVKLQHIALNVDSQSVYVHLDFLMEKMKEGGDTEKVQRLEEMKRRVEEGASSSGGNMAATGYLKWVGKQLTFSSESSLCNAVLAPPSVHCSPCKRHLVS